MREITVKNPKLAAMLEERSLIVQEGRDLQDEMEAMKKEFDTKVEAQNKVAKKLNKLQDKMLPLVVKETAGKLGEFEDTNDARVEGDNIVITIIDKVEEYKEAYRQKQKQVKK